MSENMVEKEIDRYIEIGRDGQSPKMGRVCQKRQRER